MMGEQQLRQFTYSLDRLGDGVQLSSKDLVRLAASAGLSIAEATHIMDVLVSRTYWERLLVDDCGNAISSAQVEVMDHCSHPSFAQHVHVVWRRCSAKSIFVA